MVSEKETGQQTGQQHETDEQEQIKTLPKYTTKEVRTIQLNPTRRQTFLQLPDLYRTLRKERRSGKSLARCSHNRQVKPQMSGPAP